MALNVVPAEVAEIERLAEIEARQFTMSENDKNRAQALAIAKMKYATQPRQKAVLRGVTVVCKAPAWIILAFMLPALVMRGKALPESLERFLEP